VLRRSLRDAAVVLTGAGGGIGSALARRLAAEGARLALLDRIAPDALAAELRAKGAEAVGIGADITDAAACAAAIAAAEEALGGVDVLINNAGLSHVSRFSDTAVEVIEEVMAVNFLGAVYCTAAALDSLRRRRGAVVALSSVAGFAPLWGRTGYAASKHALHGFFDTLRVEEPDLDVLVVCPSFARTAIQAHALDGHGRPRGEGVPTIGRLLDPDDVAAAVVRGLQRRQRLVLVSPIARASYWLSRLAPGLYARLMLRSQGPG